MSKKTYLKKQKKKISKISINTYIDLLFLQEIATINVKK